MVEPDTPPTPGPIASAVWSRVLAVMERLALSRDLAEVLSLINDAMRDCLNADRASVFRYDHDRDELVAEQAHGMGEALRIPAKAGIAGEAATTKRIINVRDCYRDARFNSDIDRRTGYRTRTMLTVPLVSLDGRLEGVAQVLNKQGATNAAFSPDDEAVARALASQAAVAIRRAALLDAERAKAKMENDLRIARRIQAATIPTRLPHVHGYSLAAWLSPADETAGDCYDAVIGPSGSLWVFVADAAGHGVGPALAVAQAHAMFRLGVRAGLSFDTLVTHVSEALGERLPIGMFVSAFLAQLDPPTHAIRFIAAGMAPIVRITNKGGGGGDGSRGDGSVDMMDSTMPPLGVDEPLDPGSIAELRLQPNEALVIATDGVYEQPSAIGKRITPSECLVLATRCDANVRESLPYGRADRILLAVRTTIDAHRGSAPQADDQTLLIVCRER